MTRLFGATNADNVYEKVGERLKQLRRARGLTQADVAKVIKVSPQQYQKYEDAHSKCNLNYLVLLSEYHGVSLNAIISGETTPSELSADETQREEDLLARLVNSSVQLETLDEKLKLVQFVEAIVNSRKD